MKRKLITVKETLNSSGSSCYLTEIPLWLAKVCPPGFTHIKQDQLVFQCVCLQENSSPAVHSISLPCSESLPHKSVKKGKSIMTYYCLPPMLHELALVGGENVFFQSLATEKTYITVGNRLRCAIPLGGNRPVPLKWFWQVLSRCFLFLRLIKCHVFFQQ